MFSPWTTDGPPYEISRNIRRPNDREQEYDREKAEFAVGAQHRRRQDKTAGVGNSRCGPQLPSACCYSHRSKRA